MMTDPIADMLTRIRNANRIERVLVDIPATKLKAAVAEVLQEEGFIHQYRVGTVGTDEQGQALFEEGAKPGDPKSVLRVWLKYGPEGEKVIRRIDRASKPGRRLYKKTDDLRPVLDGLGISIISTSKGVMSDRKARANGIGGEVLCTVW